MNHSSLLTLKELDSEYFKEYSVSTYNEIIPKLMHSLIETLKLMLYISDIR